MNFNSTKLLFTIAILFFSAFQSSGQLTVTDNQTAQQLVERLIGQNVAILNPTLNCTGAHNGQFDAVNSNLGLTGGIILATGTATGLAGEVGWGIGQTQASGGDASLSGLIGGAVTNDACVLEFDFVPDIDTASTLTFDYVFGSEEYPSFTCSPYNDVFGFLISGPGYNPAVNIALVPNTNIPVAINSINSGVTGWGLGACQAMGAGSPFTQYFVNNQTAPPPTTITLPGFTTMLQAKALVYPCDTYHMKLGVANVVDHALQSAVFLRENSFSVDTVALDLSGIILSDSSYLVEGCIPATITATRTVATAKRKKLCFDYGGTAIMGTDYPMMPDTLIIPPYGTIATMVLDPFQDNIPEGVEYVKVRRVNCCTKTPIDSVNIRIRDSLYLKMLTPDTALCPNDVISLRVSGDPTFTFLWTPSGAAGGAVSPTDSYTYAMPPMTTVYSVTATFSGCPPVSRSVTATTIDSSALYLASGDTAICPGQTAVLHAAPGLGNYTYNWTGGLSSNPNDSITYVNPNETTTYTITASYLTCPPNSKTVTVTVEPVPVVTLPEDITFCFKAERQIPVDVQPSWYTNYSYSWSPATYLNDPTVKEPMFFSGIVGDYPYTLTVSTMAGCTGSDNTLLHARPAPKLENVTSSQTVKYGDRLQLNADGSYYYTWLPDKNINFANIKDPVYTAYDSVTLMVVGMNEYGCTDTAYVDIDIDYSMFEIVPSAFSPNGDGLNDEFRLGSMKFQRLIEFRVFNRWGQEVFTTTDYKKGWDGTFKGESQNPGVYQYLIRVTRPDGQQKTYKGDITLIR